MIDALALVISFAGGCYAATRRHLPTISRLAGALFAGVSVQTAMLILLTGTTVSSAFEVGNALWTALFVLVLIERIRALWHRRKDQREARCS